MFATRPEMPPSTPANAAAASPTSRAVNTTQSTVTAPSSEVQKCLSVRRMLRSFWLYLWRDTQFKACMLFWLIREYVQSVSDEKEMENRPRSRPSLCHRMSTQAQKQALFVVVLEERHAVRRRPVLGACFDLGKHDFCDEGHVKAARL